MSLSAHSAWFNLNSTYIGAGGNKILFPSGGGYLKTGSGMELVIRIQILSNKRGFRANFNSGQ
jgi:hypothetical protein